MTTALEVNPFRYVGSTDARYAESVAHKATIDACVEMVNETRRAVVDLFEKISPDVIDLQTLEAICGYLMQKLKDRTEREQGGRF